jgi:hypothetical protein
MKRGGLRKKFWKQQDQDLKRLGLPKPINDYGFSYPQLQESMSQVEFKKFVDWMYGQTMMLHEIHGPVVYTEDVIRGLDLIRNRKPTNWD